MLSYHDPTAAGRETTPATVGRSVVLNDKYSQLSQSGERPHRNIGVDEDAEVAHDGNWIDLVSARSDRGSRRRRRLDVVDQRTIRLSSIQLKPVGAHPPGHVVDAGGYAVLKL